IAGEVFDTLDAQLEADLDRANERGAFTSHIPVKYLREAAELTIWCKSCGQTNRSLMVAVVVREQERHLLIVRRRDGGFVPTVYLDGPLLAHETYCQRKVWYLHTDDMRAALHRGDTRIVLDHGMKH